jgi:hypothetical protein
VRDDTNGLAPSAAFPAPDRAGPRSRSLEFLSLFSSVGTVVCCALPSVLVLLGLGATVASVLSAAPWLVMLSRHKAWVFAGSGTLIVLNLTYVYGVVPHRLGSDATCRSPAGESTTCERAASTNRGVLWISVALYGVGWVAAYPLGWLLARGG